MMKKEIKFGPKNYQSIKSEAELSNDGGGAKLALF